MFLELVPTSDTGIAVTIVVYHKRSDAGELCHNHKNMIQHFLVSDSVVCD